MKMVMKMIYGVIFFVTTQNNNEEVTELVKFNNQYNDDIMIIWS